MEASIALLLGLLAFCILSMDLPLGIVYRKLAGRKGAVVALDPRSGEILALVSSPSAEEGDLAAAMRDGRNAPLFNRATQGLYPPGSVFKVFVAALAVQQGLARPYACPAEGWSAAPNTRVCIFFTPAL